MARGPLSSNPVTNIATPFNRPEEKTRAKWACWQNNRWTVDLVNAAAFQKYHNIVQQMQKAKTSGSMHLIIWYSKYLVAD